MAEMAARARRTPIVDSGASILFGARLFVLCVYIIIGLSFVATTAVLVYEYASLDWFALAALDSHLFLFFPTLGLIALAAFHVPSCALVDMYWRHVKYGPPRFICGALVLCVLSVLIANNLRAGRNNSVWEIAPAVLKQDRADHAGCGIQRSCDRLAVLDAVDGVRRVGKARFGLRDFIRDCDPDPMIETSAGPERKKICFALTPIVASPKMVSDKECCVAQQGLKAALVSLHEPVQQRSLTSRVHGAVLPLKVFFLLVLLVISILLAVRHKAFELHYKSIIERIEVGVLVGVVAMVFFPIMSQAFVQSAEAVYGTNQSGGFKAIVPLMSFGFGAWALLILLFFYRRRDREVEMLGKMAGVIASGLAVVKYDLLVSVVSRTFGAGASFATLLVLGFLSAASMAILLWPMETTVEEE